ncbi:hypothetical protein [Streptomyces tailanensis]|uniref:hypothetical protein n=1 Tax=Streptomyces tailanensis TaxID=2569858 RepID=UPI001FE8813E|nr:hypothetical protein [Streptomyces tailanensis]
MNSKSPYAIKVRTVSVHRTDEAICDVSRSLTVSAVYGCASTLASTGIFGGCRVTPSRNRPNSSAAGRMYRECSGALTCSRTVRAPADSKAAQAVSISSPGPETTNWSMAL